MVGKAGGVLSAAYQLVRLLWWILMLMDHGSDLSWFSFSCIHPLSLWLLHALDQLLTQDRWLWRVCVGNHGFRRAVRQHYVFWIWRGRVGSPSLFGGVRRCHRQAFAYCHTICLRERSLQARSPEATAHTFASSRQLVHLRWHHYHDRKGQEVRVEQRFWWGPIPDFMSINMR